MLSLSTLISDAVSAHEFVSFAKFEKSVLKKDKSQSLASTLEIGLRVTNIGQAFSLGYRCALQNLCPELRQNEWAAFCVTEDAGAHPKKLTTTVSKDGLLFGNKSFVSMADKAKQLLVIAVAGQDADRPILKAVKLDLPSPCVDLIMMPSMGMMPEVGHGRLTLDGAQGEVLKGDGYLDFNKKFRLIEDAHLLMAFTALILSKVIRCKLNDVLVDDCLVIISSLLSLEIEDKPFNTLQLSGLYRAFEGLRSKFESMHVSDEFTVQWQRDAKVFSLANKTRLLKRNKAINLIFS